MVMMHRSTRIFFVEKNSKKLFSDAIKNNYAIGAFNFVNLETLSAILDAAKELNSPVIVQCSTGALKYSGIEELVALVKVKSKNLPVILNLDHGKSFEDCKNCIDNGFTNVMIDASHLSFEENIQLILLNTFANTNANMINLSLNGDIYYIDSKNRPTMIRQVKFTEEGKLREINDEEIRAAKETAARLEGTVVKIRSASGADGRLYGAVTAKDIAETLEKDFGIRMPESLISM